jgi:Sigma-70 factor, region 1.2
LPTRTWRTLILAISAVSTPAMPAGDADGLEVPAPWGPGDPETGQPSAEAGGEDQEIFVFGDDDDDLPAARVAVAGATEDPVKDYLKQIGKVPLLSAEQEVDLAKRIDAGQRITCLRPTCEVQKYGREPNQLPPVTSSASIRIRPQTENPPRRHRASATQLCTVRRSAPGSPNARS